MTVSEVMFDSWAWWEYLFHTPIGRQLRSKYFGRGRARPHTSSISLGELCAKLHQLGLTGRIPSVVAAVQAASNIHDVTLDRCVEGARFRQELRTGHPDASLVDGILLATARALGAVLVSADSAYRGLPDVRWP